MSRVAVWRGSTKSRFLGYWHHGILCLDGTVIHYTQGDKRYIPKDAKKQRAHIIRTSFDTFKMGVTEVYDVHPKNKSKAFPPEEIVRRAESRIGEESYSLIFNNCENFAQWCATGEDKSRQVGTHIKYAVRGLFFGTTGFLMGLCLSTRKMSIVDRKKMILVLRDDNESGDGDPDVVVAATGADAQIAEPTEETPPDAAQDAVPKSSPDTALHPSPGAAGETNAEEIAVQLT